jgi:hypothetical protein
MVFYLIKDVSYMKYFVQQVIAEQQEREEWGAIKIEKYSH